MSLKIIDAHTHVQMMDPAQQDAAIRRALGVDIGMINAGADERSSQDAVELAHQYEYVWATVGHHPQEADKQPNLDLLKALAQDKKVVGIGECGLEYFKLDPEQEGDIKRKQKELFEKQIKLAHRVQKPLVIHCREAFADTIDIVKKNRDKLLPDAGILHFFTGTSEDAKELLELGFSFTFGGLVTFNRSFDEIVTLIPSSRILAETDAPWVAPLSHRGHINEPSYLPEVIEWLAKIKGISQEEMGRIALENTKRVFRIDK